MLTLDTDAKDKPCGGKCWKLCNRNTKFTAFSLTCFDIFHNKDLKTKPFTEKSSYMSMSSSLPQPTSCRGKVTIDVLIFSLNSNSLMKGSNLTIDINLVV